MCVHCGFPDALFRPFYRELMFPVNSLCVRSCTYSSVFSCASFPFFRLMRSRGFPCIPNPFPNEFPGVSLLLSPCISCRFPGAFFVFVRLHQEFLGVPYPFIHAFTRAFLHEFLFSLFICCGFSDAFVRPYIDDSCVPICVPRVFRYMPPLCAQPVSGGFHRTFAILSLCVPCLLVVLLYVL